MRPKRASNYPAIISATGAAVILCLISISAHSHEYEGPMESRSFREGYIQFDDSEAPPRPIHFPKDEKRIGVGYNVASWILIGIGGSASAFSMLLVPVAYSSTPSQNRGEAIAFATTCLILSHAAFFTGVGMRIHIRRSRKRNSAYTLALRPVAGEEGGSLSGTITF